MVRFDRQRGCSFYRLEGAPRGAGMAMVELAMQRGRGMGKRTGRFGESWRTSWDPWNRERRTGWLGRCVTSRRTEADVDVAYGGYRASAGEWRCVGGLQGLWRASGREESTRGNQQ